MCVCLPLQTAKCYKERWKPPTRIVKAKPAVLKTRWNCAFNEKAIWWIVASMNCCFDEFLLRWIAASMNCSLTTKRVNKAEELTYVYTRIAINVLQEHNWKLKLKVENSAQTAFALPAVIIVKIDEFPKVWPGNTKGGSITVPLTSCLTGLD